MTGEGFTAEWVNVHGEEITNMEAFPTWNAFLTDMKQLFDDPNDQATALNELERLKQGTSEAPEFFAKFETLMQRAGLDPDKDSKVLIHWLELNLNH